MRSWLKSAVLCAGILTLIQTAPAQERPQPSSDGDAAAHAPDFKMDLPPVAETAGHAKAQKDRAQPSFDCGKASAPDERLICNTPALSKLDAEMAALYTQLYAAYNKRSQLKLDEVTRNWPDQRRLCSNRASTEDPVTCLTLYYQQRIAVIRNTMAEHPDRFPAAKKPELAPEAPIEASGAQQASQVAREIAPHLQAGPRVSYKDTYIGEALAPFLARRKWKCDVDTDARGKPLATTHCYSDEEQIGAGWARLIGYGFLRGLAPNQQPGLYEIGGFFPSGQYSAIREAFITKYGEPGKRQRANLQNPRGTTYELERLEWHPGAVSIVVQRYDNKGARSSGPDSYDLEQGFFQITFDPAAAHLKADANSAGKL